MDKRDDTHPQDSGAEARPRRKPGAEVPAAPPVPPVPLEPQQPAPVERPARSAKPARKQRTHWDMLLERRTIEDLEVLLEERLGLLRSGQLRRRSA